MLPIKKVLWPTDFSEPSDKALDVAVKLCPVFSAELIMVHVVSPVLMEPPGGGGYGIARILEDMETAAQTTLAKWREEKIPKDIPSRHVVLAGSPADQIVKVAEEENADLIVIATHGLTGWRRFIFGSVAERVVRLAHCPVLTIPAPSDED